jgi:hypothetical protein
MPRASSKNRNHAAINNMGGFCLLACLTAAALGYSYLIKNPHPKGLPNKLIWVLDRPPQERSETYLFYGDTYVASPECKDLVIRPSQEYESLKGMYFVRDASLAINGSRKEHIRQDGGDIPDEIKFRSSERSDPCRIGFPIELSSFGVDASKSIGRDYGIELDASIVYPVNAGTGFNRVQVVDNSRQKLIVLNQHQFSALATYSQTKSYKAGAFYLAVFMGFIAMGCLARAAGFYF